MEYNVENLIPNSERTPSELRAMCVKGGKRSGEVRREKRDLRKCIEILLEKGIIVDGQEMTGAEAISLKQFEKAISGDTKAFEVIRDTAGQKPIEQVSVLNDIPVAITDLSSEDLKKAIDEK